MKNPIETNLDIHCKPAKCIGLPIRREYGFPASILVMLSDTDQPLARRIELLRCESVETEGVIGPKLIESHSGAVDAWMQPLLDSIGKLQTAMVLAPGSELLPDGYRCGVAMPFFSDKQVEDVAVMLF